MIAYFFQQLFSQIYKQYYSWVSGSVLTCLFLLLLLFFSPQTLEGKTTIEIESNPEFEKISLGLGESDRFAGDFQDNVDNNAPHLTNAFFLENSLGYLVGTPHLGGFEGGIVFGAAIANGAYLNDEAAENTFVAPAPVLLIHGGGPLSAKSDLVVKVMIFDLFMTGQEPGIMGITLDDFRYLSLGGKYRRQIAPSHSLLPGLFNFSGLTVGVSGDILTGYMNVNGDYSISMEDTGLDFGTGETYYVDTAVDTEFDATARWLQFGAGVDALSYFEVLKIMSFYTGFGMQLGYSWFGIEADASGRLMAEEGTLDNIIGDGFSYEDDYLCEMDVSSDSVFNPFPLLPIYIVGFEMNLANVKLTAETAANLKNLSDVALLVGVRVEL